MRVIYTVELYADLPDDERPLEAMMGVVQDAAHLLLTQAQMLTDDRAMTPPTVRLLVADAIDGEREVALEEDAGRGSKTPIGGHFRH